MRRLVTELRELGLRSGREDLVAQAQQLFSTHGIDPIDEVFDPSRIWKTGDVGIKPPVAHTEVRPNFPERARRMGHAGVVIVEVLVALDGTARPYQISHSSTPNVGFEEEALRVAAEWRFYPAVQFGVPVVSQHLLVLDFGGWSAKRTEGLRH